MTHQEEYELGLTFYNGEGQEKNIGEAIKHFEIAANAGNLEAMNKLGVIYAKEEQYRNLDLSKTFLTKASELGLAQSTLNLGKISYYKDYGQVDNKKALRYYEHALKQGSIEAAFLLGNAYYFGERVEQDYSKAIHYLTIAADGGNRSAYSILGESYFCGNGVSQDYNKSFQYYLLGSKAGIAQDSFNVAYMLEEGKGVEIDLVRALEYYKIAANGDYTPAMYEIGRFYFKGIGVSIDNKEAFKWFHKAAEKEYKDSYLNVGYMYQEGLGTDKDYNSAFKYYTLGAKAGDIGCITNLGRCYEDGRGCQKNLEEAYKLFKEAADSGDEVACFNLGVHYEFGISVPIDYSKAREYYERSAESGDCDACINLGLLYEIGRGVEINREKAKYWFIKAAESGEPSGYFGVGRLYHYGIGGDVDCAEAISWYKKAADLNFGPAQNNLGTMYEMGNGVDIDFQQAFSYYQTAALSNDLGSGVAKDNLACMYYTGKGVDHDYEKAAYWFKLAAKEDIRNSQYYLGIMYSTGRGVELNYVEAFKFFRRAANNGHVFSQIHLGNAFCSGQGVEINYQQAVFWWRKAAKQGYRGAMYNLGCAYIKGLGVPQDVITAKEWWSKAALLEDEASKHALANPFSNDISFKLDRFSDTEIASLEEKAKTGDTSAQICLGDIYYRGKDRRESKNLSAYWYNEASDSGNPEAKFKLAKLYLGGFNPSSVVIRDPKGLINEAANAGYGRAIRVNTVISQEAKKRHVLDEDEIKVLCDKPYDIDEIVFSIYGDVLTQDDLLRVLFVLYSIRKKYSLTFDEVGCFSIPENADSITRSLFSRISSHLDQFPLMQISNLYTELQYISEDEFNENYCNAIRDIVSRRNDLIDNPTSCPSPSVLKRIREELDKYQVKSLYYPFAGTGILSFYLPADISVVFQVMSLDDAIITSIVSDAANISSSTVSIGHPAFNWLGNGCDAVICITPLRNASFADFDIDGIQDGFLDRVLSAETSFALCIMLADSDFCTSIGTEHETIRKRLFDNDSHYRLDSVIAYPKGVFSDIHSYSSLLVLTNNLSISGQVSFVHDGSTSLIDTHKIIEMNYSLNPIVLLQKTRTIAGQVIRKIKDLLEIDLSGIDDVDSFIPIHELDYTRSLFKVLSKVERQPVKNLGAETFWLKYKGPTLFLRVKDGISLYLNKTEDCCSSYGVGYALKAKEDITSYEYLAYVLLNDSSLCSYLDSSADGAGRINTSDFLNHEVAIYPEYSVQEQIVEESLITERQSIKSQSVYNTIVISSQANILSRLFETYFNDNRLAIYRLVNSIYDNKFGALTYRSLYNDHITTKDNVVDAIILDAQTPDFEDVLSDFKELRSKKIHIYLLSNDTASLGLRSREKDYFINGQRIFNLNGNIIDLCNKVRDDLDSENSPVTLIRSKYKKVFDAADAIDKKYQLSVASGITGFVLDGCKIEDNPSAGSCGPFRLIGHDMINVMKEKRMVPMLDSGAIPRLLRDNVYYDGSSGNRYYQYETFMPQYLSEALCYFFSATNSGVHGSQDSSLIGRSALSILMEFILWFNEIFVVESKYDFSIPDKFFWGIKDDYEPVRVGKDYVVSCIDDGKEKYYFCENIHLKPIEGLHAGCKIRFKNDRLGDDNRPRFDNGLRIVFYANEKQYYVVQKQ